METYRGLVMAQEVDSNGHMNVQYYTTRYDMASGQLMAYLGIDFTKMKAAQKGFAYVEMNIRYIREVLEDDPIHIETKVLACSRKVVTIFHTLKNSLTGEVASTAEAKWVVLDKVARRADLLDEEVRQKLEALIEVED